MSTVTPLWAGLGGVVRNACVALGSAEGLLAICEQERITRVRAAGCNPGGLPDEAIDALLARCGRGRPDIEVFAVAEPMAPMPGAVLRHLDHHFAHACSAFLPSPFESAAILVCDHEPPHVSVWDGSGSAIHPVDWPWTGTGPAELYSQCAEVLGFAGPGREQRMEAFARLAARQPHSGPAHLFAPGTNELRLAPHWREQLTRWLDGRSHEAAASVAAGVQAAIGVFLVELLREIRRVLPMRRMACLGGSLFANSYFNSVVKTSALFDDVFVPINPGNAGLAVGCGLQASGLGRHLVTPFMGPCYSPQEIKDTLDNCKLTYQWLSEGDVVGAAVDALQDGQLVAWFEGPMEWGPRALGARSILASPFAPYVLDNLNRFLKHRDPWRGYALSGLESAVQDHFDGPRASPFMECDYAPRDRDRFRHILPGPDAMVRIQTVGSGSPPRFRSLLRAFGEATGLPILVNTSFNGFREPIVCSPRDAVRVFFGTGIDMLVIDRFVLRK